MKFNEKVTGTTFHKNPELENYMRKMAEAHSDNQFYVPTKTFKATIVPESNNTHDANAKRIEMTVPVSDNLWKNVVVGYVKKNSDVYRRTKVNKNKPIDCSVKVKMFSMVPNKVYRDSYELAVEL